MRKKSRQALLIKASLPAGNLTRSRSPARNTPGESAFVCRGTDVHHDDTGFSLIEVLVVVAIILIISAIAIPNLLRSRIVANQASAVESLRLIHSSEVSYFSTYGVGYATSLAQLGPPPSGSMVSPAAAGLVDSVLAGGLKSGYTFSYSVTNPDANGYYQGYNLTANPTVPGQSGSAYFYTDQSYVIRGNNVGPASATDSVIAQ